jgi:hypothetical protein
MDPEKSSPGSLEEERRRSTRPEQRQMWHCGLRHNTSECSLPKEEALPIKEVLDKRDAESKKAWEERGKKRQKLISQAKKQAEEENNDLNIQFKKDKMQSKSSTNSDSKKREKGPK